MLVELNKFYIDNNFKIEKNFAYGIYNDRTLSIKEKGSYVKVTIGFNSQINREVGSLVSSKLRVLKTKIRALQHAITTNICIELIIYKSADFGYEFFYTLDEVYKILEQHIPAHKDICPICGQVKDGNSPFVKIKDTVVQAHEVCIDQLIKASTEVGNGIYKFNKLEFIKTLLICLLTFLVTTGSVAIASFYGLFSIVSAISGWGMYLIASIFISKMKISIKREQIILISIFSILTVISSIYFGSLIHIFRSIDNTSLDFVFKQYFLILSQNMETIGRFVIIDLILGLVFVVPLLINNFKQIKQSFKAIRKL